MDTPVTTLTEKLITGEELARMPGSDLCELVEGRIIPMSPTNWKHGRYVAILSGELQRFAKKHKTGHALTGEVGIYTRRRPDTVRGADVAFISNERMAAVISPSFLDAAPEVVVEIVSPGNTWQEMRQKIDEYFEAGVEQVWIVEPERRQFLLYRAPDALAILTESDTLRREGVLEGFTLPLAEVFV